jgi:hypothetical protein
VFGAEHPAGSILQSHRVKRAAHQRPYRKKFETKVPAFPQYYFSVLPIHDILVRIRIRGSMPLTNIHLHNLTKIKSQKEVTKQVRIKVFLPFFAC